MLHLQRAVSSLEIGDCKSAYMGMLIAEQIEHEELSPLFVCLSRLDVKILRDVTADTI